MTDLWLPVTMWSGTVMLCVGLHRITNHICIWIERHYVEKGVEITEENGVRTIRMARQDD